MPTRGGQIAFRPPFGAGTAPAFPATFALPQAPAAEGLCPLAAVSMLYAHDVNGSEIERDEITGGKSVCYKLAMVPTESDKTKVELDQLDRLSQAVPALSFNQRDSRSQALRFPWRRLFRHRNRRGGWPSEIRASSELEKTPSTRRINTITEKNRDEPRNYQRQLRSRESQEGPDTVPISL